MSLLYQESLPGVWRIDVSHPAPQYSCCYLIVEKGASALVDCGAKNGIATIMDTLAAQQIAPEQVQWIIVTHAHLDHAGAAAQLMQLFPNATLAGHPSAIKHLINPHKKLVPGVTKLYGKKWFDEQYGELLPINATRTRILADGESVMLDAKRQLTALYTPGHAWHHLSVYDATRDTFYAGDAYGVSYYQQGNNALIFPVMPPTQFDPTAMETSLRKLQALNTKWAALAHYGVIPNTATIAELQIESMYEWIALAEPIANENGFVTTFRTQLNTWFAEVAAKKGFDNDISRHHHDISLTVAGFAHWLEQRNTN